MYSNVHEFTLFADMILMEHEIFNDNCELIYRWKKVYPKESTFIKKYNHLADFIGLNGKAHYNDLLHETIVHYEVRKEF